jgi:DNA polymerase-3 subunit alpha
MSRTDDYVSLHTHTEYSNLDGCGKLGDFLRKAKSQGQDAIAFTEHGTIRQLTKLHEEAEEVGIRPIYGVELYLCDDMEVKGQWKANEDEVLKPYLEPGKRKSQAVYEYERDQGIIARYHLTVLAKDNIGLKNLMKVTSLGWVKGFYKRPRVDLKTLLEHREGLLVLSGCQSGSIGYDFLANKPEMALDKVSQLSEAFGDDFYAEIMPHGMVEQMEVNKAVRMIANQFGMKLVTSQDAHYIEPEDWVFQEAMLCINTKTVLSNPDRFKFSTQDFWQKDRRAIEETYRMFHGYLSKAEVKRSLDHTIEVADKCQAKLEVDRFKALVPAVEIPSRFRDEVEYIHHLCEVGWKARGLENLVKAESIRRRISLKEAHKLYRDRLAREMKQMEAQKVLKYFLVVWDLYKWVRAQNIEVGPGRGSVGGSLVAFLLGITDIDPLRFELLFERFLAPARIDMPDVDMDFEDERRREVISRLRERYGDDCTAQIATLNKLTGKACLKSIAMIKEIPIGEIQPVVDAIVQRSSGDERASQTIEDGFAEFPVCQEFNRKYPEVLEYAKALEGQVKALGVHAAGVVVAPEPLINIVPLELRNEKAKGEIGEIGPDGKPSGPVLVTAVDMYGVGNLGLMKLDVLGIRNLTAMRRCREAIKERHGIEIDWLTIPLDDQAVLDNFTKHNYIGIFQFDTLSADKISEGVTFTSFEDVAAMIALDRPGTARSGLATEYLKRKKDPKCIKPIHPIVDKICEDTLGVIIYQEQVQRMFTDFAGFSPATADSLRRKIAKKYGDEAIAAEQEAFVKGAVERGADEELARKLIGQIKFFGSYGFNKAHSVAYGLIGYRQMWLKTYYPIEFMWAMLTTEPDDKEIVRTVRATRKMGIEVQPPDVSTAKASDWGLIDNTIIGSLIKIKGCGESAAKSIVVAQPFSDFSDFIRRVDRRKVHKGVVGALIKAGAFNNLVPNPRWLSENLDSVYTLVSKQKWAEISEQIAASVTETQWTEDEFAIVSSAVNPVASGIDPLEIHLEMVTSMRDNWLALDNPNIWDKKRRTAWIWGRVIETKYNQIGDFHNGPEPSEEEKEKMGWGKRYANLNIEDASGRNQRVKIDEGIFESFRHIVDNKKTTATVAAHVSVNAAYHSMRASFIVDLDELALKLGTEEPDLSPFELALWRGWDMGGFSGAKIKSGTVTVMAMVARLYVKRDKNKNEMAFITLICGDGIDRDVVCFASSWPRFKSRLVHGQVRRFVLKRDKNSYILDDELDRG